MLLQLYSCDSPISRGGGDRGGGRGADRGDRGGGGGGGGGYRGEGGGKGER